MTVYNGALAWVLFLLTTLWYRVGGQAILNDGRALQAFLDSVRPGQADYNASDNPCTWTRNGTRVMCDASPRIAMLNLSGFDLSGKIPPATLSNLTALTDLNLADNNLIGPLPNDFAQLQNLRNLSLSGNNFSGSVLEFLWGLSGLQRLNLSRNSFEGEAVNASVELRQLVSLDLSNNKFSGPILDNFCDAHQAIKFLHLGSNNFTGQIPTTIDKCVALQSLNLSSNSLVGPIPESISEITTLEELDLARNALIGPLPNTAFDSPTLIHLNLARNFLTNPLNLSMAAGAGASLSVVNLESNKLDGDLVKIVLGFPSITILKLGNNSFAGPLTANLSSLLQDLDLHGNSFSGPLPFFSAGLLKVDLSSNNFSGEVPSLNGSVFLEYLDLSSNSLGGLFPASISSLVRLKRLALADNSLVGAVPPFSLMVSLEYLDLSSNLFTGDFPVSVSHLTNLTRLALAHNNFSSYNFSVLQLGPFSNLAKMEVLNLSTTTLEGEIPPEIGVLKDLRHLDLSSNDLGGEIPANMSQLTKLESLDLSNNHLQGQIPEDMTSLTSLSSLNLSNNNLSGPIPTDNQWVTFSSASFQPGNAFLCGVQVNDITCTFNDTGVLSGTPSEDHNHTGLIIGLVTSLTFVLLVALGLFIWCRVSMAVKPVCKDETRHVSGPINFDKDAELWATGIKDPHTIPVVMFEKPLLSLTFADLLQATANFNKELQIADGGYGPVYKGILADGTQLAIKVLVEVKFTDGKDAMARIESLAKVKHPNLVPLAGYCLVGDDSLLIHEYMVNGDLQRWLHELPEGPRNPEDWSRDTWEHLDDPNGVDISGEWLSWPTRHKIALGVARGLAFLHHGCSPHVIHRDVKASNILLDENFDARLVDSGLAGIAKPMGTPVIGGTLGYVPPEYGQTWQATPRGDVYSFGVVLLELVTGRKPTGHYFHDSSGGNLVGWVRMLIKDNRGQKALDPKLASQGDITQIQEVLRIGYLCTADAPAKRPTMQQVVGLLKDCQPRP